MHPSSLYLTPIWRISPSKKGRLDKMGSQYDPTKIWSTLLTNRGYFGGALVLNHTLRKTGSKYQLKIMVTRQVEADTEYMEAFAAAGIPTIVVDKIEPAPRDGKVNKGTWEKLAPWGMTEYEVRWSQIPHSLLRNV